MIRARTGTRSLADDSSFGGFALGRRWSPQKCEKHRDTHMAGGPQGFLAPSSLLIPFFL